MIENKIQFKNELYVKINFRKNKKQYSKFNKNKRMDIYIMGLNGIRKSCLKK